MKAGDRIFSATALFWMIALGLLAFFGAAYFLIYGDSRADTAIGANSFSYSAIGHRAFVETLRRQDILVRISRNNSPAKAGYSDLLIIAEPDANWGEGDWLEYLRPARNVLIVLPKNFGIRDDGRRRWVRKVVPRDISLAEILLREFVPDGDVIRRTGAEWGDSKFTATPDIESPRLMSATGFIALIADREGRLLLGKLDQRNREIWLLADPDIIANHGLGKGENAQLAVEMVREMLPPGGAVIVDETVHGFYHSPSLWRHAFELPFAAVTFIVIFSVLVLIWAAAGRVGAPPRSTAPTEAGGKEGLIEITARLLDGRQHGHYILRRYQDLVFRDIARPLHAPHKFGERAFDDWLDRAAAARGVRIDAGELSRRVATMAADPGGDGTEAAGAGAEAARMAIKLYAFKKEMVDGSGRHSSAP
jgi:hypothetical protein